MRCICSSRFASRLEEFERFNSLLICSASFLYGVLGLYRDEIFENPRTAAPYDLSAALQLPAILTMTPMKVSSSKRVRRRESLRYIRCLLLNDDYTPMEFVILILERFFGLKHAQSFEIMLTVHQKGVAVVGVFSHEIAETKVGQVMDFARRHQHPLQCTMEKE